MAMVAKSTKGLQPELLPPTEDSARQHSLRVYLQVVQWKTLMSTRIDPTDWGWRVEGNNLHPIMTIQVRFCVFVAF